MTITSNTPYNITPDGTYYLTCPSLNGVEAKLETLKPSYSNDAASQIWTIIDSGSGFNNVQLKCTLSDGTEYFLTGEGVTGRALTVSQTQPTATSWSIDANGQMTLNADGELETQYANKTGDTPPLPIEFNEGINWQFKTPIEALNTSSYYTFISNADTYLVGNDTAGAHAKLSNKLHGVDSSWSITGTMVAGTGTINNAQIISEDGSYIYGMHSDLIIQCFPEQNPDYDWTVQDNGDGTAWFLCRHTIDSHNTGYLDANGTNPVVQVNKGTAGQKWKFSKSGVKSGR